MPGPRPCDARAGAAVRTALRILLSSALALGLLWALAAWGDLSFADFVTALRRLTLGEYLLALAIHVGIYAVRAQRFRTLIPGPARPPFLGTCAASSAHNLAAYVLPAKTGEATLVLYLKASQGVGGGAGLASLLVSRLLDLGTLAAGLGAACLLLVASDFPGLPAFCLPLGVGLLIGAAVFGLVVGGGERPVYGGLALARRLGLGRSSVGSRIAGVVERVAAALAEAGSDGRFLRAALLSIPIWLGVFLFYAVLARAVGLGAEIGLVEATFGSGLAVASNLLPINAFAAFGTQEAGWTLGFGWLGVERDLALSTAVAVHLVQLFDVVLLGVLGHVAMGAGARSPASGATAVNPTGADPPPGS